MVTVFIQIIISIVAVVTIIINIINISEIEFSNVYWTGGVEFWEQDTITLEFVQIKRRRTRARPLKTRIKCKKNTNTLDVVQKQRRGHSRTLEHINITSVVYVFVC